MPERDLAIATLIGLVALWAVLAFLLNEGKRKARRREMGLPEKPLGRVRVGIDRRKP